MKLKIYQVVAKKVQLSYYNGKNKDVPRNQSNNPVPTLSENQSLIRKWTQKTYSIYKFFCGSSNFRATSSRKNVRTSFGGSRENEREKLQVVKLQTLEANRTFYNFAAHLRILRARAAGRKVYPQIITRLQKTERKQ